MKGYIVTGASKGLGLALTRRLLAAGHRVIGISRTAADAGDRADGAAAPRKAEHYTYDLKRVDGIEALIATIVGSLEKEPLDALTLINNAGMLEPIMPLEQADSLTLTEQMNVNLLAPMLLMSTFIRATTTAARAGKAVFRLERLLRHQGRAGYADALRRAGARRRAAGGEGRFDRARCRGHGYAGADPRDGVGSVPGGGALRRAEANGRTVYAG